MDFFDIKTRLGVPGLKSFLWEINQLLSIFTSFKYEPSGTSPWPIHSDYFNYPVNWETCKVHDLLNSFQASNYHLFVICSTIITIKIASFMVFFHLRSMLKGGKKMLPIHNTESVCNKGELYLGALELTWFLA